MTSRATDELSNPTDPMRVAREILADMPHADGVPCITWWRGEFYRWTDGRWKAVDNDTIDGILFKRTEKAYIRPAPVKEGEEPKPRRRWSPTPKKIADLRGAMSRGVLQLDRDEEPDDGNGRVSLTNGVFDVATRTMGKASPRRFNLVQLPFAYDPAAVAPRWEEFLKEVSDGDDAMVTMIQDWFGQILFGDGRHHKIMYFKGPERCGKGTIARILTALVGPDNVASPSLDGLGGNFGAQNLIGKTLAIMPDMKWVGRNVPAACEVLLKTSGMDGQDIGRKYLTPWSGTLPTRIMMLSNDMPKPHGSSTALANRFLIAHFRVSFLGREDPSLTRTLLTELPGIFNWALNGYDRLTARGHFEEPDSSAGLKTLVKTGSSPVRAFVDEMCRLDGTSTLPELHDAYRTWAKTVQGTVEFKILERDPFAQQLWDVVDGLSSDRPRVDGKRVTMYKGLSLA